MVEHQLLLLLSLFSVCIPARARSLPGVFRVFSVNAVHKKHSPKLSVLHLTFWEILIRGSGKAHTSMIPPAFWFSYLRAAATFG